MRLTGVKSTDIVRHLVYVAIGIILAIWIVNTGILELLLRGSSSSFLIAIFFAGFFFTSLVTVAPASVVLFEIAQAGAPVLPFAIVGALGAMLGDFLLFRFIKGSLGDDIVAYFRSHSGSLVHKVLRMKIVSICMIVLGAVVIASPLPDEIGLAMMGIGEIKTSRLLLISFVFNALGIFVIGLAARGAGV